MGLGSDSRTAAKRATLGAIPNGAGTKRRATLSIVVRGDIVSDPLAQESMGDHGAIRRGDRRQDRREILLMRPVPGSSTQQPTGAALTVRGRASHCGCHRSADRQNRRNAYHFPSPDIQNLQASRVTSERRRERLQAEGPRPNERSGGLDTSCPDRFT